MTSASRMMYAFSRDGAVPGSRTLEQGQRAADPVQRGDRRGAVCALILTLPALKGNKDGVTVAFTAVVSIGVIGLYVAYVIPIFLRWRMGDEFEPGPWTLGKKYKWMAPISRARGPDHRRHLLQPAVQPAGRAVERATSTGRCSTTRRSSRAAWRSSSALWWVLSAKNWFTGPRHTIAEIDAEMRRAARVPRGAVGSRQCADGRPVHRGVSRPVARRPQRNGMTCRPFLRDCTA